MSNMSDEEFEKIYGRPPRRVVKVQKIYWNRIIIAGVIALLLLMGLISLIVKATSGGSDSSQASVVVNKTESKPVVEEASSEEETGLDFTICIDPGHGDFDSGTTSLDGKRLEKDDNLKISLLVEKYLKESNVKNIIMTRTDDTFIDLEERSVIANDGKADLFVCLHRNSYDDEMSGVEIWVNNLEPEPDITLADNIMDGLKEVGINNDRGVQFGYLGDKTINYSVNSNSIMPSCLVELGFLTDESDNELFDKNIDAYAKAISDAIIKTAKDLKIIDDSGKRLITDEYISTSKWVNTPAASQYVKDNHLLSLTEYQNSIGETPDTTDSSAYTVDTPYNTQEKEY